MSTLPLSLQLLFGEPEGEAIAARLSGARLVSPALLSFELANVCLIKSRRDPKQSAALTAAFRLRHQLGVEEIAVDHEGALQLAAATGLTAYGRPAIYGLSNSLALS